MKNKYEEREKQYERLGEFDRDLRPYRTDNARAIDETYKYSYNFLEHVLRFFIIAIVHIVLPPILFFSVGYRVRGRKNLKGVKSGIIVTNHVHYFDCLMVEGFAPYRKVFHTGAGFNAKRGIRGELLKLLGYMPLNGTFTAQKNFNKRLGEIFKKGGYVQFYPEHALWLRYKKPRPYMDGAFKYAAKFSVPVIPTFITFENSPLREFFGLKERAVINVMEPIYPDENLTLRENAENLSFRAQLAATQCYTRVYGKKPSYETEEAAEDEELCLS